MTLEQISSKIQSCKDCQLWETRNKAVSGGGNPNADILFVGEAPGRNEDQKGIPFVGKAGEILDGLLESVGINREDTFITNVVKCRPPQNRNPTPGEIKSCSPYLDQQIDIIKPKIIATLGNFATSYVMQKFGLKPRAIGEVHGQKFKVNTLTHNLVIVPLYHPAAIMYDPSKKNVMEKDFNTLNPKKL